MPTAVNAPPTSTAIASSMPLTSLFCWEAGAERLGLTATIQNRMMDGTDALTGDAGSTVRLCGGCFGLLVINFSQLSFLGVLDECEGSCCLDAITCVDGMMEDGCLGKGGSYGGGGSACPEFSGVDCDDNGLDDAIDLYCGSASDTCLLFLSSTQHF